MNTIEAQIESILFKYIHLKDDIDQLRTVIAANSMELNLINVSQFFQDRFQSFL